MGLFLLLLVLALIFFGAGFALHVLWVVAIVFAVVWIVSFLFTRGRSTATR
jgi:hypothetical protein